MEHTLNKGSEWRKWDLHIHTPFTKLSDNYVQINNEDLWKTFCGKIENSDVEALGITDYFCADNYFIFLEKYKTHYPDSKKIFFPNIEFRLDVSVNKKAEEVNIHVIFSNEISREKINEFLQKLDTNITRQGALISCKGLNGNTDYKSAGIKYSDIKTQLLKVFGNKNCYLICAASNNAGLRPDTNSLRKLNITDEIDKICHCFFGGQQNVEYFLKEDRYETGEIAKAKPVVSGCDAHSFEDIDAFLGKRFLKNQTDEIVKDITWIKAELTFEGLKQIVFEPDYRVKIGESVPRQPIRKIDSVKFNFPENTVIKRQGSSEDQAFCLSKLKSEIYFSPYFTCLIGGRGTGKSTIINLIAKRLGNPTEFFEKDGNNLYVDGNKNRYDIKNDPEEYIGITGTNDIEFVSQGRVENLTEGEALANLIFEERILETNAELEIEKGKLNGILDLITEQIALTFDLNGILCEISEKKKEIAKHQNVVDSINDPNYTAIVANITNAYNRNTAIDNSIIKYNSLLEDIKIIIQETSFEDSTSNEYEGRIKEILSHLLDLEEYKKEGDGVQIKPKTYEKTDSIKKEVEKIIEEQNKNLSDFFSQKGTSEESIKDSQKSNESIPRIQAEITALKFKKDSTVLKMKEKEELIKELEDLQLKINNNIEEEVEELNKKLAMHNESVSAIKYEYQFNHEKYKKALCEDFHDTFKKSHILNLSWDNVYDVLLEINPNKEFLSKNYSDFYQELENKIEGKKNTLYGKFILDIFLDETNFKVYQLLIKKHLFNSFKYIQITGFYGNRELKNCSFGQKCTAVIVTLLMTGVKPLVIDEPEAHLDNRLIADYLVGLIKEKKPDRQIIFATHNANFVINGDAELIHILEMPDDGNFTTITSTTIENVNHREKLLKLEGGKDAFQKREQKLL